MNDNQRFISLQYIKGENYEEITCFNYDNVLKELKKTYINNDSDDSDDSDDFEKIESNDFLVKNLRNKSTELYAFLKNEIEDKEKCKIGENLLNDLVNYYNFKDIRRIIKTIIIVTEKELYNDINNIEKLKKIYKTYIRLCNTNIAKYENIFNKNEISNIDDAFMIESYSKFLKKLNILKENLEGKDTGKLTRLLINSLEKLLNLYGIDPNKELIDNDFKYLKNYIINY
jgi:hypothetical protein